MAGKRRMQRSQQQGIAGSLGGRRFCAAPNAPYNDQEAHEVIAPALLEIAKANQVGDVRSLTKRMVLDAARSEDSPLHKFVFNRTIEEAAEQYFLAQADRVMRGLRIATVSVGPIVADPVWVSAESVAQRNSEGQVTRKSARVLRDDALKDNTAFNSVLGGALRRFFDAFAWVERWTATRKQNPEVAELISTVRDAIDRYQARARDAAE